MNTTPPRPTPETDAEVKDFDAPWLYYVNADFARKLERERDEALAKLSTVYRWIERNHSDGFIDSQSHLQNLDRVADAWHDKLEDMQRELGKTRDQLKAMREAIKEAHEALDWATSNMNPPFEWEPFTRANATLTKLQPFIKP